MRNSFFGASRRITRKPHRNLPTTERNFPSIPQVADLAADSYVQQVADTTARTDTDTRSAPTRGSIPAESSSRRVRGNRPATDRQPRHQSTVAGNGVRRRTTGESHYASKQCPVPGLQCPPRLKRQIGRTNPGGTHSLPTARRLNDRPWDRRLYSVRLLFEVCSHLSPAIP